MKTARNRASENAGLVLMQEATKTAMAIGLQQTLLILENSRLTAAPAPADDPVIQSYLHAVSLAFSVPVSDLLSQANHSSDKIKYARGFAVYFLHHNLAVAPHRLQILFAGRTRVTLWRYRRLVETLSPSSRVDKAYLDKKAHIERSLYQA